MYTINVDNFNGELVANGNWGESITWEMYASSEQPPEELTTAVAGVALAHKTGHIVLTRNQRSGWEVLAGHVEPGESVKTTLIREAFEEGGFTVTESLPIGYRKITAKQRPLPDSRGANYPYPTSYIAYFLVRTDRPNSTPTGEEILESRSFSPEELRHLVRDGELSEIEYTIINLGLEAERQHMAR